MEKRNGNVTAKANASGISFCGLLTIVFIVLKLTGFISWPWVWVLAPLWLSWVIVIAIIVIAIVIALIVGLFKR